MKKNFDEGKAVRTVQGADGGKGIGKAGNTNPSNQDVDTNTTTNVATKAEYSGAANPNMGFDGGVGHNYTAKMN